MARLTVTETQHMAAAARPEDCLQVVNVRPPLAVLKDMEQSGIQHGIELLVERGQVKAVPNQETRCHASLSRFALGDRDGRRSRIDAGGVEPKSGGHQRVLTGPAARIQDPAPNLA